MKGKSIHTVLATAAILALTGCAGLGAPVVSISKGAHVDATNGKAGNACDAVNYSSDTLNDAITYAGRWRSTYLEAAASHSKARTAIVLTAIPMAALGLYYSVTGAGSAKRVAALGAGGATAYGVGSLLTSKNAQTSYLNGAQAMTCAIEAVMPEKLPHGNERDLSSALKELQLAIDDIEGHLAGLGDSATLEPGYSEARYLIAEAKNVLEQGIQRYSRAHNAVWRLRLTVDRIVAQVAQQVVDQEPGLDSLLQTASGLKAVAQGIGLPPVAASSGQKDEGQSGQNGTSVVSHGAPRLLAIPTPLANLKAKLANAVAAVRKCLWAAALNAPAADLSSCLPKQPVDTFTVAPSEPNHVVQVGKKLNFVINYPASSAFPTMVVDRNTEKFVEIDGPRPVDGNMTVIVTGNKATQGNAAVVLTIRDPSGRQSRVYQIQVISKAQPKK